MMRCINHPDRVHGLRRGLCASCYQTIMKMIRSKEITDKGAIRQGYIKKPRKAGRKRQVMPFPNTIKRMQDKCKTR